MYLDPVAGFINDSLPGSFGEEILDNFFMQNNFGEKPSIIDKLLFIGNRGLGALDFRPAQKFNDDTNKVLMLKDTYEEVKRSHQLIQNQRKFILEIEQKIPSPCRVYICNHKI